MVHLLHRIGGDYTYVPQGGQQRALLPNTWTCLEGDFPDWRPSLPTLSEQGGGTLAGILAQLATNLAPSHVKMPYI